MLSESEQDCEVFFKWRLKKMIIFKLLVSVEYGVRNLRSELSNFRDFIAGANFT